MSTRAKQFSSAEEARADEDYSQTGKYQKTSNLVHDTETSDRYKKRWMRNREQFIDNIDKNPCYKERQMALKCMERENGNVDRCRPYSNNAKKCQEFWKKVVLDRKRKGIEPNLPVVEDRDQVRKDYAHLLPS